MAEPEAPDQSIAVSASGNETKVPGEFPVAGPGAMSLVPQVCSTCGATPAPNDGATAATRYVYVLGRIKPQYPDPSVENEVKQAIGRIDSKGLTDRQALHSLLAKPENRYLVRQICWVMTIAGLETYIVVPRDPVDFSQLVDTLRPTPRPGEYDLVIGVRGPIASPDMCNGLMVPIVLADQIYSFHRDELIKAIPRPEKMPPKEFTHAAEELFDRVMQITDNAGATDEDRAATYLMVRYGEIFNKAAEMFARNFSLSSVEIHRSSLSALRMIMKVVFSYSSRDKDVKEQFFVLVDVTKMHPYLQSKLSPYLAIGQT